MRFESTLKKRLKEQEPVIGTWSVLPSAAVTNVLGSAGFDFVILDLEHGPASLERVEDMVRAADSEQCTTLVRVPVNEESWILRALETGAHGIVVPHISTSAEAEQAVKAIKYAPQGNRGMSPYTRSGGYVPGDPKLWTTEANARTLCVLIVEGVEGLGNLAEICEVPGVDVVYLGIYDISQSLGYPGEISHPEVVSQVESCVEIIREKGLAAGCLVQNEASMRTYLKKGFQFLAYAADCALLHEVCRGVVSKFCSIRSE
ncbi:MAG: aldolase/citrate lyase family protein [bacterium]